VQNDLDEPPQLTLQHSLCFMVIALNILIFYIFYLFSINVLQSKWKIPVYLTLFAKTGFFNPLGYFRPAGSTDDVG
jgi:hypothetical protein